MATTLDQGAAAAAAAHATDQGFVLHGVDWRTYSALRALLDQPGLRMTYFQGTLELMSPSRLHEDLKKRIARLLEVWSLERDVPLYGYGQTTFGREEKEAGLEPDECYVVGKPMHEHPDIAIEVTLRKGFIDKLKVYQPLGVGEVWFWIDREGFQLYWLGEQGYEPIAASALLPSLDLEQLAGFVRQPDQHEAVRAYRDALRAR